ncbi:MAG TPA: HAD hydrolase family protein [Candidatus Saccharimonadales bacterium]|nr:HAD hydrolase family protein [Candidatus Saccharimonadales bacterium]
MVYPQITYGGAEIRTLKDDNILWAKYLQDEEVKGIVQYLIKNNIYFSIEKDNYVFTPDGERSFYKDAFIFKKIANVTLQKIPKIVVSCKTNKFSLTDLESIVSYLTENYKDVHVIKGKIGEYYGLDITAQQATKHVSVLEYLRLLDLEPEEVVGVGDGFNDYPLLTACGMKAAMGNAPEELKKIADFVAPTQEEDGIVTVIEKYFN